MAQKTAYANLRLKTFNALADEFAEKNEYIPEGRLEMRIEEVVKFVTAGGIAVMAQQESDRTVSDALKKRRELQGCTILEAYSTSTNPKTAGQIKAEGVSLVVTPGIEIVDWKAINLDDFTDTPWMKKYVQSGLLTSKELARMKRGKAGLMMKAKIGENEYTFLTGHLYFDPTSPHVKLWELMFLLSHWDGESKLILMGDLNSTPLLGDMVYKMLNTGNVGPSDFAEYLVLQIKDRFPDRINEAYVILKDGVTKLSFDLIMGIICPKPVQKEGQNDEAYQISRGYTRWSRAVRNWEDTFKVMKVTTFNIRVPLVDVFGGDTTPTSFTRNFYQRLDHIFVSDDVTAFPVAIPKIPLVPLPCKGVYETSDHIPVEALVHLN